MTPVVRKKDDRLSLTVRMADTLPPEHADAAPRYAQWRDPDDDGRLVHTLVVVIHNSRCKCPGTMRLHGLELPPANSWEATDWTFAWTVTIAHKRGCGNQ